MKTSHLFGSRACRRKLYVVNCAALGPLADENNAPQPLGNAYRYDQLNRLVHAKSYRNLDLQANVWKDNAPNAQIYENIFSYDLNGNIESQLRRDETGFTMDNLTYRYDDGTYGRKRNRLYHVNDAVTASAYPDDIDDQGTFDPEAVNQNNNYRYDELGRLISDAQENIQSITWRHDDKISSILKANDEGEIEFTYGPSGNRLSKTVIGPQFEAVYIDYYIRDAQGNVLATYRRHFDYQADVSYYTVAERAIYGSDRMGVYAYNDTVYPLPPNWTDDFRPIHTGHKKYELKNHLGNVMAVVHGRKQAMQGTGSTISHYTAIPAFSGDYSAFGVRLRGRGNGDYRYGFNGMEGDDEVKGSGNSLNYKHRMYEARIARFFAVDPIASEYPMLTPYQHSSLNPIMNIELEGLEGYDSKFLWMEAARNAPKLNMTTSDYVKESNPLIYKPNRASDGMPIVDNTGTAVRHYYSGRGETVRLGPKTQSQIRNSADMNYYRNRIMTGQTSSPSGSSGSLPINMEPESARSFHVGKTSMSYSTICEDGNCSTTFTIGGDGFWDPLYTSDNEGSGGEVGGIPYKYEPFSWSETYENPGYETDENGIPNPIEDKVTQGEGAPNSTGRLSSFR